MCEIVSAGDAKTANHKTDLTYLVICGNERHEKTVCNCFLITTIIVSGLALVGTLRFSTVKAATDVTGIISVDTTWTKANSPYILAGPVFVPNSVTLTIEPGVTVYLNDTYLKVNGTLAARGTSAEKILLLCNGSAGLGSIPSTIWLTSGSTNWDEQTGSGTIIENTLVSSTLDSHTISIEGTSPKINNCTVINTGGQRAISVKGGSPIISNNSISAFIGIVCQLTLVDPGAANASISGNIIAGCEAGIEIYNCSPVIEGNLITNNTGNKINGHGGIAINYGIAAPIIRNNTIVNNSVGLNLRNSPSPIIIYNNIMDNDDFSIYLNEDSVSNVNATYNW